MNTTNDFFCPTNQPEYAKHFLNYIRGLDDTEKYLSAGESYSGGFVLPQTDGTKYLETLKKESLFRRIGTYVYSHGGPSKVLAKYSEASASWIPDGGEIPAYDGLGVCECVHGRRHLRNKHSAQGRLQPHDCGCAGR